MPLIRSSSLAILVATGLFGCASVTDIRDPLFRHDVASGPTPWTKPGFDVGDDRFTFAVFSDLTGGERPRIFEIAVAQLNLLRPELIMNVGDLIEGASASKEALAAEWAWFDERTHRAKAPVFYVGGNHDLTGEVLQQVWDERYGRRYYHFVYKNVLFLVLDTEDNTPERTREIFEIRNKALEVVESEGWDAFERTEYFRLPERLYGNISATQAEYFRHAIRENPNVRWTFVFLHKAPWERPGEAQFAAIEAALSSRLYTVFHGHAHSYAHLERHGRDYIRLATTGGVQFPMEELSADHVTLVTVDGDGVDIANLLLSGVLDKTGHVPLSGDDVCFEAAKCGAVE